MWWSYQRQVSTAVKTLTVNETEHTLRSWLLITIKVSSTSSPPHLCTPVDAASKWRDVWQSTSVANVYLISDSTVRLPGFNLSRSARSTLNRFHTWQGRYAANLYRWLMAPMWRYADNEPHSGVQSANQINQSKLIYIAPYVASESVQFSEHWLTLRTANVNTLPTLVQHAPLTHWWRLHSADDHAISCLQNVAVKEMAKWN